MGKAVKSIFGGGDDTGAIRAAQEEQRRTIDAENQRIKRVEEGQRKAASGGRGLLAFLDDDMQRSLGGSR